MNAEQALERVKARLMLMPTSRIVNTNRWDAIPLRDALRIVDEVAAELSVQAATPAEREVREPGLGAEG